MTYMPPIVDQNDDGPYTRPDMFAVRVRCAVCHRVAYVLMSSGCLEPWSRSDHRACGTFDLDGAKGRLYQAARRWRRSRHTQEVKLTPHSV
jgi:hypothetical protein